jgi:hypothetical protein
MPDVRHSPVYPPERWAAAGPLLRARRIQLMGGVDNQAAFCRLPGGPRKRIVVTFEKGRPDSPPLPPTIARAESAWGLKPGALHEFLSGKTDKLAVSSHPDNPEAAAWKARYEKAEQRARTAEQKLDRLTRQLRRIG